MNAKTPAAAPEMSDRHLRLECLKIVLNQGGFRAGTPDTMRELHRRVDDYAKIVREPLPAPPPEPPEAAEETLAPPPAGEGKVAA